MIHLPDFSDMFKAIFSVRVPRQRHLLLEAVNSDPLNKNSDAFGTHSES